MKTGWIVFALIIVLVLCSPVFADQSSRISAAVNVVCYENWTCGEWSNCMGGTQTRDCVDLNSCGTFEDKPTVQIDCGHTGGGSSGSFSTGILVGFKKEVPEEPAIVEGSEAEATGSNSGSIDTALSGELSAEIATEEALTVEEKLSGQIVWNADDKRELVDAFTMLLLLSLLGHIHISKTPKHMRRSFGRPRKK